MRIYSSDVLVPDVSFSSSDCLSGRKTENPQAHLKAIKRRFTTENDRLQAFDDELDPESEAQAWYDGLPEQARKSWTLLEAEFNIRWPRETKVPKSVQEKQEELMGEVLKEEDVGVRLEVDGVDELGHVRWASKILRLTLPTFYGL